MDNRENGNEKLIVSLRVLNQIGASILSDFTVEQIIDTVYHHVNRLMDAYSFAIGIYNPASQFIDYVGARENDKKLPAFSVYAHNEARFSGWVFAHRSEILINDYENEYQAYLPKSITALQGMEPASLMYVPLFINKEIIGILSVRTQVKNAYSLQCMEILKTLAVFIAKGIENARITNGRPVAPRQLPKSYYLDPVSAREIEVMNLLSKGYTNPAIAKELFISASTVKTHTLNIYRKLQVSNRTQAINKAKEYGLIGENPPFG